MDTTENYSLGTKLRADSCLYLFAFTLLYYDHLLTFDDEVKFMWSRPNHISSRLFFLNRYFSFVGNIVILLSMFFAPSGQSSCHPWEEFQEFFHAFAQIIVATLLTMRVYALYARDRRVLIVLTGIILFGIGATVISLVFSESTPAPSLFPIGCHDILDLKNAALVSVGWELVFIYDTLLFGMTVFKAYRARSQPRVKQLEKFSVFTIIVRDGSIYFGIMALANLVNVLTFYLAGDTLFRGTLSPFASCMSVTLMSRLMLHLHKITSQGLYAWYGDTVARPADSYTPDATMSLMDFGPKENHYSQESIDHSGDISVPEDTTGQSNSGIPGPSTTNFEIMEV
ncbi:uncharacterized protein C8R40DRAFT_1079212 [Lentinula edodes]|uniref:uncharacterized protein n=1 Tax=Lentinula edodes TaxID=5353 RepID=UPI001E8D3FEF|nr:uncharacterized protein C8R40DRAFT_1079212 [Lentinula edodes]KAH7881643.1 hypothetical protein C8R40DRAFT_1079212 [Lentinula edodes]